MFLSFVNSAFLSFVNWGVGECAGDEEDEEDEGGVSGLGGV